MISVGKNLTVNKFTLEGLLTVYELRNQSINMVTSYENQYEHFSQIVPALKQKIVNVCSKFPNSKPVFLDHVIINDPDGNIVLDVNSLDEYYPQAIVLQNELSLIGVDRNDYESHHAYIYVCRD